MATKLEQKGRKGDKVIGHLTPGEIVIPRFLAEDDNFRATIANFMRENGADPEQFIVGSGKNKINPETGYMEFGWFSKIVKSAKKFVGGLLGGGQEAPKAPPLPPPIPTPEVSKDTGDEAMRRAVRKGGRRKTIITGNLTPISTGKKKLLG